MNDSVTIVITYTRMQEDTQLTSVCQKDSPFMKKVDRRPTTIRVYLYSTINHFYRVSLGKYAGQVFRDNCVMKFNLLLEA